MRFTKKVLNIIVATTTALSICGIQMFAEIQPLTVEAISIDYLDDLTLYVYDDDMDGVDDYIEVSGCDKSATEVIIPDDVLGVPVTIINYMAFYDCSSLTSVYIGDNVTEIEFDAFNGCENLENVTLPSSLTTIGDRSFIDCKSIVNIEIPDSVTSIGSNAFQNCESLENVSLSNNITNINSYLFSGCSSLETIVLPNTVTSIGDRAFYECSNLTNITIPENVKKIGVGLFYECSSLEEVILNDNIETIDDYTFAYCSMLESIILPKNLKTLGSSAFSSSGIELIKFDENIKTIGSTCFLNCKSLEDVYITNPDNWCNIAFSNEYANPMCYANNLYVNGEIANTITLKDTTEKIKQYAFYSCESLEKIFITNKDCKIVNDQDTIIETATIYGYTNSTAQEYAEEYNRNFVAIDEPTQTTVIEPTEPNETSMGDANDDGKINVRDCAFIASALAKGLNNTLSDAADFNNDGKVNVRDAAAIAAALAKGQI